MHCNFLNVKIKDKFQDIPISRLSFPIVLKSPSREEEPEHTTVIIGNNTGGDFKVKLKTERGYMNGCFNFKKEIILTIGDSEFFILDKTSKRELSVSIVKD